MTTATCLLATILAAILLPLIIMAWLAETPQQRARRWRAAGASYRTIGERLHISQTTARRWCIA